MKDDSTIRLQASTNVSDNDGLNKNRSLNKHYNTSIQETSFNSKNHEEKSFFDLQ